MRALPTCRRSLLVAETRLPVAKGKGAKPKKVESELDRILDSLPEDVRESVHMARSIAVDVGRALSLTIVAALAPETTTDEAIAAMDKSWRELADKIMLFALDKE